jgi:thiosulfate/3-mercaptopyruvate sulfurtransferase
VDDRKLLVDAQTLATMLGDSDVTVVDCRFELMNSDAGRTSYLHEHIPGAVYADLDKDLAAPVGPATGRHPLPDAAVLADTFGRLGVANSSHVVVYDDCSGAIAARAWWLLRWLGHDRVSLLDGGIAHWRAQLLPLEAGEIQVARQQLEIMPRPQLVLDTSQIVAAGASCTTLQLVDARDATRFAGDAEPIDPVAGHIPGAITLPLSASLNRDGTWKDQDQLRDLWDATLGEGKDRPWSVMCGSGVTACHVAISGLLAGLPEPRVYVGSWSEWIRDPNREIAIGEA